MTSRSQLARRSLGFSVTAGLLFIPACGTMSSARQQPDHVFSACSPAELDQQSSQNPKSAAARYPGDEARPSLDSHAKYSTSSHEQAARESNSADGVVSLNSFRSNPMMLIPGDVSMGKISNPTWRASEEPNPFRLVSYNPGAEGSTGAGSGGGDSTGILRASFIAAEPRLPQQSGEFGQPCPPFGVVDSACPPFGPAYPGAPLNQMETVATGPSPDLFPDEYVMDGGDRDVPVHYEAGDRRGLDSEDTVAEFADHTGRRRMKPSNKVAVYAPRFGSVRTISGLETDIRIDKAVGARDSRGVGGLNTGLAASANILETGIGGLETQHRPDGVNVAIPPSQAEKQERLAATRKVDRGREGRATSGSEVFNRADAAVLSQQLRNAIAWTRNDFPHIAAKTSGATDVIAVFKVQQTVGIEDERKTKGDIRLIKLADRSEAQAGDTIKFTIEFENTGDFDVYDVKIVDNLTPRLVYVEGSAAIDPANPGEVTVTDNGEGSHILTFTLDKPLKGHTKGVITFEARVR